jgi:dTDP-4-amino-4,6-dideoxygalactose transaminase
VTRVSASARTATQIRFTAPFRTGLEAQFLGEVLESPMWHGDGAFTQRATEWVRSFTGAGSALLTTSGTHALELAAILLDLQPGDEVICPSFTFTSTATAIALRGATPVFVDIRPDTLNLDVAAVAAALTDRTRAVFVVHYGGVAADIEELLRLTEPLGIPVVEDNAHGMDGYWHGRHLGTFGTFGAQSFHDTKNITSGEGGALLINDARFAERAEVVREKGTDRAKFLRGAVDKYTWQDVGSSYLPSELNAALLLAQASAFASMQRRRREIWSSYATQLAVWCARFGIESMHVPHGCDHPAHVFYLMMPESKDQAGLIKFLGEREISAVFHYQPLDSSPAGRRLGRTPTPCDVTADRASRIVRLPLHPGLSQEEVERVVTTVGCFRPGR